MLARDQDRCVVPGCSSRRWLHLHHLLIHDGRLALDRLPSGAWRVEHLDGRVAVDTVGVWVPHVG